MAENTGSFCGTGDWSGPKPGDPDNNSILSAVAVYNGVRVSWTFPVVNPAAVAFTRIYRGLSPSFALAMELVVAQGNQYFDPTVEDVPVTQYYWISIVSVNGTVGALIGPAQARPNPLVSDLIEQLTGKIDAGVLAQSLKTDIARINLMDLGLLTEVEDRQTGQTTLANAVEAANNGVAQALTFVYSEIQDRTTGDSALLSSINVMATTFGAGIAAVTEKTTLLAAADTVSAEQITQVSSKIDTSIAAVETKITTVVTAASALSTKVDTVQTTLASNIASVETGATTTINALDSKVGALYTAKVTVNGLVGGFGIYNNGTQVDAGFDVDTFFVGRTQANKKKPFIVTANGTVLMDKAMIGLLTADDIDTRGLTIRNDQGTVILDAGGAGRAGVPLDGTYIKDLSADKIKVGTLTGHTINAAGVELGANVGPGLGHSGLSLSPDNFNDIFLKRDDGVRFFRVNDGGTNRITFDSSSGNLEIVTPGFKVQGGVLTISQLNVINTANIAGEQITVPRGARVASQISINGTPQTILSFDLNAAGQKIYITAAGTNQNGAFQSGGGDNVISEITYPTISIHVDGVAQVSETGASYALTALVEGGGNRTISLVASGGGSGAAIKAGGTLFALGCKR